MDTANRKAEKVKRVISSGKYTAPAPGSDTKSFTNVYVEFGDWIEALAKEALGKGELKA